MLLPITNRLLHTLVYNMGRTHEKTLYNVPSLEFFSILKTFSITQIKNTRLACHLKTNYYPCDYVMYLKY